MLAVLRRYTDTGSEHLATVDLMHYSPKQIVRSLVKNDTSINEIMVVGFEDWNIKRVMTIVEAYQLRLYIENECQGDESLVKLLLKKCWDIASILACRFSLVEGGDREILTALFEGRTTENIANIVYAMGNARQIITGFMMTGKVVATSKGFYLSEFID